MKQIGSLQKYTIPLCVLNLTVLLFLPAIAETRRCKTEQYWHTLFVKCMPCNKICKPLNRSVCQTKCADYARSLSVCSIAQYWEPLYGACINCSVICDPPSRDKCKEKCSGYIENLQPVNTETLTVPNATSTDTTLTTDRWITHHVAVITYVAVALSMTIAIIIGLYYNGSKIAKCAGKYFIRRDDKMPIEETGNRGCQSDDPLVEPRQHLV